MLSRFPIVVVLMLCVGHPALDVRLTAAGQDADSAVVAAVKRALTSDSDLRRLTVTASGNDVTLSGRVPTLWHKLEAVKRALKVEGVKNVVSDIELPRSESDQNLALFIGRAIDRYPYQTLFDYIDAVILKGVVRLTGSVTGERNKAEEIAEEVARVRGVQEIRNEIVMLPPSQHPLRQHHRRQESAVPHRRPQWCGHSVRVRARRNRVPGARTTRQVHRRCPSGDQQPADEDQPSKIVQVFRPAL
jgi:osmotically-inducible protein OsmY